MNTLTSSEKLTRDSFKNAIELTLKYLFINYKKYISLDDFVKKLSNMKNINLISIFDCCRETKEKGKMTKEERE